MISISVARRGKEVHWAGDGELYDAMVAMKLIDIDGDSVVVHEWAERMTSYREADRKRKSRRKDKVEPSCPQVSRTVPDSPRSVRRVSASVPE